MSVHPTTLITTVQNSCLLQKMVISIICWNRNKRHNVTRSFIVVRGYSTLEGKIINYILSHLKQKQKHSSTIAISERVKLRCNNSDTLVIIYCQDLSHLILKHPKQVSFATLTSTESYESLANGFSNDVFS